MKLKTSTIAMAVAGTLATPMAAQADLYASVRVGVENVDTGGVSDLNTSSFGSRFGVRSETDLGNGWSGFGRYEWDVDMQNRSTGGPGAPTTAVGGGNTISARHRYVGLKGDAGSLTIGQTYHTYYNLVYGPTDSPWWGSGYVYPSPGRTDNGVTWAGSGGAFNYSLTAHFFGETEEESPDVTEVAVSFAVGDLGTVGIGARIFEDYFDDGGTSQDESDTLTGVVWHGIPIGDGALGVGFQSQDEVDAFVIEYSLGGFLFHYESQSNDSNDPTALTLGYTHGLGRNTTAWFEVVSTDADTSNSDDDLTVVRGVLKYDIE